MRLQHQVTHVPQVHACVCGSKSASMSVMMTHWESGSCIANRQRLNRLVHSFPKHDKLVVPGFGDHLRGTFDRIRCASPGHYNNSSGQYICPFDSCEDIFRSLTLLDQHLASPWHDVIMFKCPDPICEVTSSSLSGLFQHAEGLGCTERLENESGILRSLWKHFLKDFGLSAEAPTKKDMSDSLL